MEAIRIGVIGTGVTGERHCRVCANLPRADFGKTIARNTEFGAEMLTSARVSNALEY